MNLLQLFLFVCLTVAALLKEGPLYERKMNFLGEYLWRMYKPGNILLLRIPDINLGLVSIHIYELTSDNNIFVENESADISNSGSDFESIDENSSERSGESSFDIDIDAYLESISKTAARKFRHSIEQYEKRVSLD